MFFRIDDGAEPMSRRNELFKAKVAKRKKYECWPFTGCKTSGGYGQFQVDGKMVLAHRYAWELRYGKKVPEGLCVCHLCDNPSCCNPKHLFVGTMSDNMNDASRKGRLGKAKGEAINTSKLTEKEVLEIRTLYNNGETQRFISQKYKMSQSQISNITRNKHWSHIKGDTWYAVS